MNDAEFNKAIDEMPDDVLKSIAASMPWSTVMGGETEVVDEDGFPLSSPAGSIQNFHELQEICWNKFLDNPQINSHVRDFMGNLTGYGFFMDSPNGDIAALMKTIIEDPRNSLYKNMSKFVARSEAEGELFLCLTLHTDGFVEVDFWSPRSLRKSGYKNSGIFFHKTKANFPLYYDFHLSDNEVSGTSVLSDNVVIPSINIAYFPEYANYYKQYSGNAITEKNLKFSRSGSNKYKKLGGFKRFIIEWDRGYFTTRNVSHIRTTIVWMNHYENLKKWEIDHKKSSGSYLWVASIEDAKSFRTWLKLTEEQRQNTGLFAKKKPGGTLVLPPGIKLECINPNLPKISDADTDIMGMVISGLNKPEDMVTGATKGSTFSGVKASRGPAADRIQDHIAYFDRFLRFDFWRPIFLLHSKVTSFKLEYMVEEVVDFKNKKPVKKRVKKFAHDLVSIEYPVSEVSNMQDKASALLGVKHPSVAEVLGIPNEVIARKLGIGNYRKHRLQRATEEENFPDLPTTSELEMLQEKAGEPKSPDNEEKDNEPKPKPGDKNNKKTEENS